MKVEPTCSKKSDLEITPKVFTVSQAEIRHAAKIMSQESGRPAKVCEKIVRAQIVFANALDARNPNGSHIRIVP